MAWTPPKYGWRSLEKPFGTTDTLTLVHEQVCGIPASVICQARAFCQMLVQRGGKHKGMNVQHLTNRLSSLREPNDPVSQEKTMSRAKLVADLIALRGASASTSTLRHALQAVKTKHQAVLRCYTTESHSSDSQHSKNQGGEEEATDSAVVD